MPQNDQTLLEKTVADQWKICLLYTSDAADEL